MVLKVKYQKFGVCMILCIWKKSLMLLCSEVSYFFFKCNLCKYIFSIITPDFSVTWSSRKRYDMV